MPEPTNIVSINTARPVERFVTEHGITIARLRLALQEVAETTIDITSERIARRALEE